uniref:Uncharacterized protein n=1 Tax=Oryza glumipatula TaxID=40148 RepID=A0A0D9Z335_9ORYZ
MKNDNLAKPNCRFPPNQVLAGQFKRYADTLSPVYSLHAAPRHLPSRQRQQRRDKRGMRMVDGSVRNEDAREERELARPRKEEGGHDGLAFPKGMGRERERGEGWRQARVCPSSLRSCD